MDVARAAMGQGWPFAAGLWNGDGVSEPSRSEGRMNGRKGLVTLPAKSLAREGETKDINKNATIRNKHSHKLASPV